MKIICPSCGARVSVVSSSGRKRKDVPVLFIMNAIQDSSTMTEAAQSLGISRATIKRRIEEDGTLKMADLKKMLKGGSKR